MVCHLSALSDPIDNIAPVEHARQLRWEVERQS